MKAIKGILGLAVFMLCAGAICYGQQMLRTERARRLAISGSVENVNGKLYPLEETGYEVLLPAYVERGTPGVGAIKAIRLHFVVKSLKASHRGTWKITLSSERSSWEFNSKDDPEVEEFWSPEMSGSEVTVRVFSTIPESTLRLMIDQKIEYTYPTPQQSIVDKDDTVPITEATDPRHVTWGLSVARLTFISEEEKLPYTCTGFLIAKDLLITNDHCPRTKKEIRSTIVEFDYDSEKAKPKIYRLVVPGSRKDELPRDENLDFALYRLNKLADREFLRLKDDDKNLGNERPLVIIQHPAGLPKRVASFKCNVKTPTSPVKPAADFGHECDTQGGSSGSPVQSAEGRVIGLHHFGFDNGASEKINQAVKIGEILKFIRNKDENLYKTLTAP